MKKINNIIIFILSLASLCIAIKDFNYNHYDRLLVDLSLVLVFLIPRVIGKIFSFNLKYELEFVYIIFIFFADFLGSVINLYSTIWWYDLFMHFISGILTSILSLMILKIFKINKNKIFSLLFLIIFTIFVAALWEFFEFFVDQLLKLNVQHSLETGVNDTMEDMLIATFGGILFCIVLNNNKLYKKISNLY